MTFDDLAGFDDLMTRVHAGDADAAAEIVRQFEPEIRREVRLRLTDPKLRRIIDSIDICQSVLGNFLVRAALGQFEIEHPDQLFRLLITMARNKVIDRHRNEVVRRNAFDGYAPNRTYDSAGEPVDAAEGPASIAESREMLTQVLGKLSDEEKRIAGLRQKGIAWDDIARTTGISAQTLRKRLSRACDRIMGEFPDD